MQKCEENSEEDLIYETKSTPCVKWGSMGVQCSSPQGGSARISSCALVVTLVERTPSKGHYVLYSAVLCCLCVAISRRKSGPEASGRYPERLIDHAPFHVGASEMQYGIKFIVLLGDSCEFEASFLSGPTSAPGDTDGQGFQGSQARNASKEVFKALSKEVLYK